MASWSASPGDIELKYTSIIILLALIGSHSAYALQPHEVALIVNKASQVSMEIGNHYAALRAIPPENVFYVSLPKDPRQAVRQVDLPGFDADIFRPVSAQIKERGLRGRILAWVYSVDFPVRVLAPGLAPVSLQGATLTAGYLPSPTELQQGAFISPFFTGDAAKSEWAGSPRALLWSDAFNEVAGGYPSMMLGYTEARGNTPEEVLQCLERSARADGSQPSAGIRFVKQDDVRSTCRDWQFAPVADSLVKAGFDVRIVNVFPSTDTPLLGVMVGKDAVPAGSLRGLVPGSMGDDLTSGAANFDWRHQTKLTEWIRAGASVSAGTVSEPYALWMKFPTAAWFLYYTAGCSALECYFQSVRCPLQLLIVGDPLTRPFGRFVTMRLSSDGLNEKGDALCVSAQGDSISGNVWQIRSYVDGQSGSWSASFPLELPLAELSDGYHELRVAVSDRAEVPKIGFAELGFEVKTRGRSAILQREDKHTGPVHIRAPETLHISCSEQPEFFEVRHGLRVLSGRLRGGEATQWVFDPRQTGCGPVKLQVVAFFKDGMQVASSPLELMVTKAPASKPQLAEWTLVTNGTRIVLMPELSGISSDAVKLSWREQLGLIVGGVTNTSASLAEKATGTVFQLSAAPLGSFQRLDAVLELTARDPGGRRAGMVFGYQDASNYGFWGLEGDSSSWCLERIRRGKTETIYQVGRPVSSGVAMELALEVTDDGLLAGWIQGERLFAVPVKGWRLEGLSGWVDAESAMLRGGVYCSPPYSSGLRVEPSGALSLPVSGLPSTNLLLGVHTPDAGSVFALPSLTP